MRIVAIVEGHGEVSAVPILLRRMIHQISPGLQVEVPRPIRVKRTTLLKPNELERAIQLAGRQTSSGDGILVLLDADDDCPALLGPALLGRGKAERRDREVRVVLAKREFETWFVAAAPSLAGRRGLGRDLMAVNDPESIRDAKGWLSGHMPQSRSYRPTLDQPALANDMDLQLAKRSPSFDKLWRDITSLVHLASGPESGSKKRRHS